MNIYILQLLVHSGSNSNNRNGGEKLKLEDAEKKKKNATSGKKTIETKSRKSNWRS